MGCCSLESDKRCLLSPILFNIFLERITTDAFEDHEINISFGRRTITNLRFADDIDGLAREETVVEKLVERLHKASIDHGIEISAKKAKLMTNNTSGLNRDQSKRTEALDNHKLQVLGFNCI